MEDIFRPVLRQDIYINDLYKNESYIIGCYSQDSHFLLNKNKVSYYKSFFNKLDGKNDLLSLSNMGFGSIAEIEKIIEILKNKGFIENFENINTFNEAEIMSIKFKDFNFTIHEKYSKVCESIRKLYKYILLIVLMILCIIMCITKFNFINNVHINDYNGTFTYIIINLLTPIIFIFHEVAHRITGISYGLKTGNLSIVLFLGCIPLIYVKQKAIYSLERKKLIQVLLSGILANLLLGFIFFIFAIIYNNNLLYYFVICNFRIVYMNLLPISLTDGYFITCILLKTPNIRLYMYKLLANPKFFFQLKYKERIFSITMLIIMIVIIYSELFWFLSFIKYIPRIIITFITCFVYIIILHKISRKKLIKGLTNI